MIYVLGGSASTGLAFKVARAGGFPVIHLESRRFPDGEQYLRILDDVEGRDVAVIQSMYRAPDQHLLEYVFLVKTLKELGVNRVVGVIPYFPYARQDSRFNPGEVVSLNVVADLVESAGTDEVITVDMHLHRFGDVKDVFKIPARNLSAVEAVARYVKSRYELSNPVVVGPDEEAEQWAKKAAAVLGTEYDVLEKRRIDAENVVIEARRASVGGRDVFIIDDIISTGGTIVESIRALKRLKAEKIVVGCIHPILAGNALAKIFRTGAYDVIGTDTVPSPISYVTVAEVIAEALKQLA